MFKLDSSLFRKGLKVHRGFGYSWYGSFHTHSGFGTLFPMESLPYALSYVNFCMIFSSGVEQWHLSITVAISMGKVSKGFFIVHEVERTVFYVRYYRSYPELSGFESQFIISIFAPVNIRCELGDTCPPFPTLAISMKDTCLHCLH